MMHTITNHESAYRFHESAYRFHESAYRFHEWATITNHESCDWKYNHN